MPISVENWHDNMWSLAAEKQFDEIEQAHGKEAAENANYGWGDASDGERIDIATKVYLEGGAQILSTTASYPSEELHHEWSDY